MEPRQLQLRSCSNPPFAKLIPNAAAPEANQAALNHSRCTAKFSCATISSFRVANPSSDATFVINLPYTLECMQRRLFDPFACDTTDHYLYYSGPTGRLDQDSCHRPVQTNTNFELGFSVAVPGIRIATESLELQPNRVAPDTGLSCRVCNELPAQQSQMQHHVGPLRYGQPASTLTSTRCSIKLSQPSPSEVLST